jgi:hypothetical protein
MVEYNPYDHSRFLLHYSDTSSQGRPGHTVHFHSTVTGLPTDAGVITEMQVLRDNMSFILNTDQNLDAFHFSNAGSNITFPVGVSPLLGGQPIAINPDQNWGEMISFVGRTLGGQPTKLLDFGLLAFEAVKGRLPIPTGNANIDNFWTFLNGHPTLIGDDGQRIIWYGYINVSHSKYWLRKSRQ